MVVRLSFPRMGWSYISFKAMLNAIPGVQVCTPPPISKKIIELGSKNSPEFVCFPFKVTLGEFINMAEMGIDTFVMAIDCGPCRFGFYAPVQEQIMKDLGYNVKIIPIQQNDLLTWDYIDCFKQLSSISNLKVMQYVDYAIASKLALQKAKYIEDIMQYEGLLRCREKNKGSVTKAVDYLMEQLDRTNDDFGLREFQYKIFDTFAKIPFDKEMQPLRVLIAGENHVFLESFVNLDLVRRLGDLGIEVHLGHSLYDWMMHKLHLNFRRREKAMLAKDYIPLDIGGEAQWVIGEYIHAQNEGFDGFVHVYPFTCMPEVAARSIIESDEKFQMPVIFFSFDEHSGSEGMRTRLEAFKDLMNTRREEKIKNKEVSEAKPLPKELLRLLENRPPMRFGDIFKPLVDLISGAFKPANSENSTKGSAKQ